eukprot:SAG31_NODE_40099_length_283_cov_0.842391_1_plen_24_part_01
MRYRLVIIGYQSFSLIKMILNLDL